MHRSPNGRFTRASPSGRGTPHSDSWSLTDEIESLVSLASEDKPPGWWRQYSEVLPEWFAGFLSLESEAARLLAYESEVVPGLLQTEDYATEILRHSPYRPLPDEAARAAELRRARQVRTDLLATVGATVRSGAWLNDATAPYPVVVLGAQTARLLGFDGHLTTVYTRSADEVRVSRPSDALAVANAASEAFTGLLLGLGSALGVLLGVGVSAAYELSRGWPVTLPAYATLGALALTVVIGTLAGLYPAIRAARLTPTEALTTP